MTLGAIPDALTKAITAGKAVPVTGAGVSIAVAGYPSWAGLIESGINFSETSGGCSSHEIARARMKLKMGKLIPAAQAVKKMLRAPGGQYAAWLESVFERSSDAIPESRLIDSISDLMAPVVATTNYDDLLERFLLGHRQGITWRDPRAMLKALHSDSAVFHLHGHFNEPESVVFGADNYGDLVSNDAYHTVLKTLWIDRTLLFIGCSFSGLEDPDFSRMLTWFAQTFPDSSHRHFALLLEGSFSRKEQAKWLHQFRIQAIPYGPGHQDLEKAVRKLNPNVQKAYAARIVLSKRLLENAQAQDVGKFVSALEGAGVHAPPEELRHAAQILFQAAKEDRLSKRQNFAAMQMLARSIVEYKSVRSEMTNWRRGKTRYEGSFRETVKQAAAALFLFPESLLNALKQRHIEIHQNVLSGYCRSVFEEAESNGTTEADGGYAVENLNRILTSVAAILHASPGEVFPDIAEGMAAPSWPEKCLLVSRVKCVELRSPDSLEQVIATLPMDLDIMDAQFAGLGGRKAVILHTQGGVTAWDPAIAIPFKEFPITSAYGISSVSHHQDGQDLRSLVSSIPGPVFVLENLDKIDIWNPLPPGKFLSEVVLLPDGRAFGIPSNQFQIVGFLDDHCEVALSAAELTEQIAALPILGEHWNKRILEEHEQYGDRPDPESSYWLEARFQNPALNKVEVDGKAHLILQVNLSFHVVDSVIFLLSADGPKLKVIGHFWIEDELMNGFDIRSGPGGELRLACTLLSDYELTYDLAIWARAAKTSHGLVFVREGSTLRTKDDLLEIAFGDPEKCFASDDSGGLFQFSMADGSWKEICRNSESRIRALRYYDSNIMKL